MFDVYDGSDCLCCFEWHLLIVLNIFLTISHLQDKIVFLWVLRTFKAVSDGTYQTNS